MAGFSPGQMEQVNFLISILDFKNGPGFLPLALFISFFYIYI
jgi:hypothetical protein